ncbi:MAG: sensor domain-containing diguanylate cyclase [Deltaproteobacteria bacterium]|nr:sensor domain-containing diguanylate cyclase [Deltaproteobacteria bacterium]
MASAPTPPPDGLPPSASSHLGDAEPILEAMMAASPIGFLLLKQDRIVWTNQRAWEMLGLERRESLWGVYFAEFLAEAADRPLWVDQLKGTARDGRVRERDYVLRRRPGGNFTAQLKTAPLEPGKRGSPVVLTLSDISRRKIMETTLRESEERLATILASIHAGIMLIDAATHQIMDANPAALTMVGRRREEVLGRVCHTFICPAEKGKCPITDLGQKIDNSERWLLDGAGQKFPILKTVAQVTLGGRAHLLESFLDISELKRLEKSLAHLAATDSLTGLLNRRCFCELAQKEVERSRRYGSSLSLISIDLDHFKRINDAFGHPTGDVVLQRVAGLFGGQLRQNDLVGRLGGEEFAVLLPETVGSGALDTAERLRRAVAGLRVTTERGVVGCTTSLGVTWLGSLDENLEDLLRRADDALYEAKRQGRDRVCSLPALA